MNFRDCNTQKAKIFLLLLVAGLPLTRVFGGSFEPGAKFQVGGRSIQVLKFETLHYVESDYSRRFKFDSFQNPKLRELREKYRLDEVIAGGKDEFEKQVMLNEWVHERFKKFGKPSSDARGALEILEGIDAGNTFFCTQFAELMVSSAASLGWVDRTLALRRHKDRPGASSTEHSTTEIWSNQHRKWVMLDPTSNLRIEKAGVPLNAWEIRQEWFYHDGKNLDFIFGREGRRYKKSDLPARLKYFEGFGELRFDPDECDKYGFIGYIPNTDLMNSGFDYSGMFIVKDALCEGTKWHQRILPQNPAVDPYFPINQAELTPAIENGELIIAIRTLTPNLKTFEARFDEGEWEACGRKVRWPLKAGKNKVEARSVNQFEVAGPVSTIEIRRD